MLKSSLARILLCALAAAAVVGCETIKEKRTIDYKSTRTLPPLEVPPDLTGLPAGKDTSPATGARASATYSEYVNEKKAKPDAAVGAPVLAEYPDMKLVRDDRTRWLVVKAEPEKLWPQVREFVVANGLIIARENPQTGVIETDWAENRAKVGTAVQRVLAKWLSSLYSTGTRDKFRIRLERGAEPNTTEIYLSHQGMEEVVSSGGGSEVTHTMWQPRVSEPELETEMLRLLMVHLGAKDADAAAQLAAAPSPAERAHLARSGDRLLLSLQDDLDRAWRRVGQSLDRIGFTVEDRDRSKGIYYVRWIDPEQQAEKPGFFARLFGAKPKQPPQEQYLIQLKAAESGTDVAVLDKDGAPDKSRNGERILGLLQEQLR